MSSKTNPFIVNFYNFLIVPQFYFTYHCVQMKLFLNYVVGKKTF